MDVINDNAVIIDKQVTVERTREAWLLNAVEKLKPLFKNQGTLEIIPIEEYAGSEDVSEEKQIMHLMNWKEKDLAMKAGKFHFKNFGSFKSGWDAPHNIKYRQTIYQEKHNLITETPDTINYTVKGKTNPYYYSRRDAKPFFVEVNDEHTKVTQLHIGSYGSSHFCIKTSYDVENPTYAGRLWLKLKVISFWVYPNDKLFVSIISALEEKLKIKIFNNDWKIEVIKNGNDIEKRDPADDDTFFKGDFCKGIARKPSENDKFIPLEEYIGSENPSDELRNQHMMNWKEKQAKKISINNFGSSKTSWDKPHNIKYRQAIYQENKKH